MIDHFLKAGADPNMRFFIQENSEYYTAFSSTLKHLSLVGTYRLYTVEAELYRGNRLCREIAQSFLDSSADLSVTTLLSYCLGGDEKTLQAADTGSYWSATSIIVQVNCAWLIRAMMDSLYPGEEHI